MRCASDNMVCQCRSKSKSSVLRKPNRSPPPPPPPPRRPSPAQSSASLDIRHNFNYGGADSECYSEGLVSVQSSPYPMRHLQLQRRPSSPASSCTFKTAPSEYCCSPISSESCRPYYTTRCCPASCAWQPAHCCTRKLPATCCETRSQGSMLSLTSQLAQTQLSSATPQQPPVPRERVLRPKLSVSPIPQLKNNNNNNNETSMQRKRCKPAEYRRHVEQHIERVFKYLRDREKRLEECKAGISAISCKPEDRLSIEKALAHKETTYLRSLRARLGPGDFEEIKDLGSGYIGNVTLVLKRSSSPSDKPQLYAMKKLKKSQVFRQNQMAHVKAERDILAEADNEWIVKLYYSFQDDKFLYFILEYCPGGDMMNLLCEVNVFPEDWARFYIAEISLALQFVHDMKFIHRDIKPDNILIDAGGHIKLTDFGLCTGFRWTHDLNYYRDDTIGPIEDHQTITKALTKREIQHALKRRQLSLVGSPHYIAPEVLRQNSANERLCDWWSVGVILYEMVVGYTPFVDLNALKKGEYDASRDLPEYIQARIVNWRDHLAFPSEKDPNSPPWMVTNLPSDQYEVHRFISNDTKALIQGLLCDPNDRLCQNGIQDLIDHPFFRGIDWHGIQKTTPPFVPKLDNEYDTRHFGQPQFSETDATLGPVGSRMDDFTFRCFWNAKPRTGGRSELKADNPAGMSTLGP